jgi:predicted transcriptional regulator
LIFYVVRTESNIFFATSKKLLGESLRNYRSRLDIIANILDVVNENPKKTQIMIQANLSFKLLQKYLAEIVNAQLVSFEDEKRLFKLEDKGRHFLKCYKNYSKTYRSAEKRLDEVAAQKKVLEELCSSSFH